jgi:hypothetical protein
VAGHGSSYRLKESCEQGLDRFVIFHDQNSVETFLDGKGCPLAN